MAAPEVYYDIATKRLDAQIQQIDQLDAKTATVFVSASGILAIFAGLLSLAALPTNLAIKIVVLVVLGLASAIYVALLYFLYRAYKTDQWHFRPDLPALKANCANYEEQQMQQWVADECLTSLDDNTPLIIRKALFLRYALIAFPVEAALLVIAGAITLVVK